MPVVIKCAPVAIGADGAIVAEVPIYKRAQPTLGDTAYIWTSETSGGSGLAMRGVLRSLEIISEGRVRLTVRVNDRQPARRIGKAELDPHRDDPNPGPLPTLAKKLYKHSLNKVADLTAPEARYLDSFFG